MNEALSNFHFLRPGWLLLLPLSAALLWSMRQPGGTMRAWAAVCDQHLLQYLQVGQGTASRRSLWWLLGLGWLIAVVALAGPVWQRLPQSLIQNTSARVVVLDLSRSMLAADLKPSRLLQARFKLEDLLSRSNEGQTALVAYAADAFVVSPLTTDTNTISNLLRSLDPSIMPTQGSSLAEGMELAGELLKRGALAGGEILVVADSADPTSVAMAGQLAAAGYRVSVLGVGTVAGAPIPSSDRLGGAQQGSGQFLQDNRGRIVVSKLEVEALTALAAAGGGRYVGITGDGADLDQLLSVGLVGQLDQQQSDEQSELWVDQGPWLVLLLLPLVALGFRRGWLLALVLIVAVPDGPARAADVPRSGWRDWLRNDEQRAEQAMRSDQHEQALALSRDPLRRGNALFRAGDYSAAEQSYAQSDTSDGHYNRGNALAKQQQYQQAIDAYDETLGRNPGHEDAEHNKKLVEELLKQQQEQQQQQDQNQDQQENDEQDQQQEQEQQQDGEQDDADQDSEQEGQPEPEAEKQEEEPLDPEEQQAVEQWLRRVPDDPGGLLRRKFRLQHQQRGSPPPESEEDW